MEIGKNYPNGYVWSFPTITNRLSQFLTVELKKLLNFAKNWFFEEKNFSDFSHIESSIFNKQLNLKTIYAPADLNNALSDYDLFP